MRVITKKTLRNFWEKHEDAEQALKAWYHEAKKANWESPNDIKQRYRSADFLPGNRVVFNIKGNHYRLVVKIVYEIQCIYVRFVGTHKEYDRINSEEICITK